MDEQQQRIMEDLAGQLSGEIRCDALTTSIYSTDASLYQMMPLGVVFPHHRDDVITLAKYADESGIPLIPRGAGTGLVGEAIGNGLIVDFSRHMKSIVSIDRNENTIRVQPGIVRDQLNAELKKIDRYFPPDPSNSSVTTVGGMLAVDAAGSRSIRVGSTRDYVKSLEMVFAGGQLCEFGNEPLEPLREHRHRKPNQHRKPTQQHKANSQQIDFEQSVEKAQTELANSDAETAKNFKRTLLSKLAKTLSDHRELIEEKQPRLIRNCSGYFLRKILNETKTSLNIPRMLVGSEGTLGMFTEATLHTLPLPKHRGVALLLFRELANATGTIATISHQQPSACDLLDRRLLSLAREADPRFAKMISPNAEAALIIEQTGYNDRDVKDRIRNIIDAVRKVDHDVLVAQESYSPEEVDFLWSLPSKVVQLLTRLKGTTRPQPFVEDIAVPPESLNEFLISAQRIFQKHQVTASLYAHAASGQLHLRPFLPAPTPHDGQQLETMARDLYQAVFAVGGTISGEHGDGLARTAFIRSQYGPLYAIFRDIKNMFDPHNVMNPGKIISDDPHLTLKNIRPKTAPLPETVELNLKWNADELNEAVDRCNSCGVCRTQSPESRMCPFFRVDSSEAASPRAKVGLLRDFGNGRLDPRDLSSEAMRELADLCFNCKQCQIDCPSNVNVPQMMIEAKAVYVAANGLKRTDWLLSRIHSLGAMGSTLSFAVNWVMGNRYARWWLEKIFGIAKQRKLPKFARRSFLRSMDQQCRRAPQPSSSEPTVVYFVNEYANYCDTELARAFVAVLRHQGIRVHVPSGQTGSGMGMVTAGDLEAARDLAEKNVRELAELAREGYPIVCTEPSAAVCLTQEYPMLLGHPDVELVASHTIDAVDYLAGLAEQGKLKTDFAPLNLTVGYHTPCHQKALGNSSAAERLLALIPGLTVRTIEEGCSGMAGAFGLTRENFSTSLQIGEKLITRMQTPDFDIGMTECSSCKIQMEQKSAIPTTHPIKLLALAYGLIPEIQKKLVPSRNPLIVT